MHAHRVMLFYLYIINKKSNRRDIFKLLLTKNNNGIYHLAKNKLVI